jgi:hypothetical protein
LDLHQLEKVRPVEPVMKGLMLIYCPLAAERINWLLETTASF